MRPMIMLLAFLAGCCDPVLENCPTKYNPGTCPDTTAFGVWEPELGLGMMTDGSGWDAMTSDCQTQWMSMTFQLAGLAEDMGGVYVYGGWTVSGDLEARPKGTSDPFVTMDSTEFLTTFGNAGVAGMVCDQTGELEFTCALDDDTDAILFSATFTLDAADPNRATLDIFSGNMPLGEDSTGTYDCSNMQGPFPITLVRTSTTATVPVAFAEGNQIAECVEETTGGDTGTAPAVQPPPMYNGKAPGQWTRAVHDRWKTTLANGRHQAVDTFVNEYVLEPERQDVRNFGHFCVDRYAVDPAFAVLIDSTSLALDVSEDADMVADFVAGVFIHDFFGWRDGMMPGQEFNPPPPPPQP